MIFLETLNLQFCRFVFCTVCTLIGQSVLSLSICIIPKKGILGYKEKRPRPLLHPFISIFHCVFNLRVFNCVIPVNNLTWIILK